MRSIHAERALETTRFGTSSHLSPNTAFSGRGRERVRRQDRAREARVSNHGLIRKRAVKGAFGLSRRTWRNLPAHAENPGRDLRPHFPLSSPRAASRLVTVGKLKGISSASRWVVFHPQSVPISGALHASALTLCWVGCLLAAPVALLGQLPRGAKGVAVVTCPPSAGL